jgi:hypothetical protein
MAYEWSYPCHKGDWRPDQAEGIERVTGCHLDSKLGQLGLIHSWIHSFLTITLESALAFSEQQVPVSKLRCHAYPYHVMMHSDQKLRSGGIIAGADGQSL